MPIPDPLPLVGISSSTLVLPDMPGVERAALPEVYVRCTHEAGGLPVILPNLDPAAAEAHVARLDGLVLSGGYDVDPDHYGEPPHHALGRVDAVRDAYEIRAARAAHAAGLPILAICRGIQVLNVAFGGSLVQDLRSEVEGALRHDQLHVQADAVSHRVQVVEGTRLHALLGATEVRVNSFHHQAVDRVAEGYAVSARAPDGVIEGLEDPRHPFCVAVQWHPERRPADPLTRRLFGGFLEAVRARRAGARAAGAARIRT